MFAKVIKKLNGSIGVWLMKDLNNGYRIGYFDSESTESMDTLKDLISIIQDGLSIVCLEETITTTPTDLDLILS